MFGRFVLFLVCASVLGCSREAEPVSAVPKTSAEFVPAGPIGTEAEAIATAWRFVHAHPEMYLTDETVQVNLFIDTTEAPAVAEHSTLWFVERPLVNKHVTHSRLLLGIDKQTGAVGLY